MGAHPKNKITRVEQGKRRRGNTPKLQKNTKQVAVPLHKKSLAERFAKAVLGAVTKPATKKASKPAKAVTKVEAPKVETTEKAPAKKAAKPAVKKTTKTAKKAE